MQQKSLKLGIERNGILYRQAREDDANQLAWLYDFVYEGGYSIADCLDPERIKSIIGEDRHIWVVAENEGGIVGATVAKPEEWNESYETCRSVTHPGAGGKGIGSNLYDLALHAAFHRDDCDIAFGYPRTMAMKRLMERIDPPINVMGTDFGMHITSGNREIHLQSVVYNPLRQFTLIEEPIKPFILDSELEQIVQKLNLSFMKGAYPSISIVGSRRGEVYECDSGRIVYEIIAPSKSAVITGIDADTSDDIKEALGSFERYSPDIMHLSFYVLSDKSSLISALTDPLGKSRFHICSYIPGWYSDGNDRYSAFSLAKRLDRAKPTMHGTEDLIEQIHDMYERLAMKL
ncbi:MAG: GNAT family N-acetyltransferase [Candidatus Woesearchaeota archaeon]|nr:GNAT family N-acetyltransferase [Candidatus Woesearchaeota archaeon]